MTIVVLVSHRRGDGTYVGTVNGGPYHFTPYVPYWGEALGYVASNGEPPLEATFVPPERVYVYSKMRMFAAMTDAEYAVWEQMEEHQSKRKVRMLKEAIEIRSDDPLFSGELRPAMVVAYGEDRTQQILDAAEM